MVLSSALTLLLAACGASDASTREGREEATEAERIVEVLGLEAGMHVADVGAGAGRWSKVLAEAVGSEGRVWATEVAEDDLRDLEEMAEGFWLENIRTVLGSATDTGLPEACCDRILLRLVYHHFTDPEAMRASLRRAMRPGALLAVIDITPQEDWGRLDGVPERGGHGIGMDDLVAEMTADGFEEVARFREWPEDEDHFCVVFRVL